MNTTTDTSLAAWRAVQDTLPDKKKRILGYVEKQGDSGATCEECEQWLGMSHQTASSTITHLKQEGWLIDSGHRRDTRTGNRAIVYVLGDGSEKHKSLGYKARFERAIEALQAVYVDGGPVEMQRARVVLQAEGRLADGD